MASKWTAKDFEDNNSWSAKDFEPVKPKSVMFTPPKINNDIFMDAPKSVSSLPLNSRKQLNTFDVTKDVSPKQGFWDKARNLKAEDIPIYKNIIAPFNKAYEIPLTQRFFVTAGNTIGGEGTVKNDDGSAMQKMDAGKVGNLVSDIAGTGVAYGMKLPGMNNSVQGSIDRVLNPLEAKLLGKLPNISKAGFKAAEYGSNALKNSIDMSAGNVVQGVAQGQSMKDIKDNGINGLWQGALFGTALKGTGEAVKGIGSNINPKWETTFESKVQPKSAKDLTFRKNGELVPQEGLLGLPSPRGTDTPLNILPKGENPIEMGGYKDNLTPKETQTLAKEEAAFTQKPSLGATDRLHSMTQIVSSDEAKIKPTIKDRWNKLYTRFVDSVSPTKKISENTHILATNTKNAGGIVDNILTENLVDRQGKKIGESFKKIVKDIPENKQDDFMNYVLQRHNIDRAREGKHVYTDFTPEESLKAVQLIEQLNPEYKALNDRLVKFVRDFESEWGNKSGLITDEVWQNLQDTYKNYVPTQRSFDELEQGFSAANGRGFVDQGNTLKKATGSDRDIINPLENIMQLVNKTVRTAKYNEVGQSMLSEIRKDPGGLKHLAEIIPDGEVINPNIKNVVTVLDNGKPVNVKVNNKQLLEALQGITKANVGDIEAAVKKGTNIFKSLITTKNPVFAVRNIARDIPTAYINGSEANPVKFIRDLGKAGKDIVTNSERFQQYKGVGGGGSNFFKSDNTAKNVKELTKTSTLNKIGNVIEHINNIIESAPRLAEFNRILDKTGNVNKALFAASDITTNFSRGGDITKHLDSFVPYLNAGVQGLDKLARQFVNKPIPTAAKGLVGITSLTLVLDHANKDNPEYKKLDNRTKDNYFIFPDVNNDGKFIKIPKSRELGVLFGSLFERTLRASRGEDNSFKGFGNTVATNFSPANPLESNIFSPALGLKSNKDFANRDIVPRAMTEDNRSKYLQYDEKTSEITKAIASQLSKVNIDLSPKQMDYLIKSYTGVIGQLGLPATTKATMTGTTAQKLLKPITTQFIADPLYSNQITTDFYDNYDKIKNKAADKNINKKIPSKVLTPEEKIKSRFAKASSEMSDLNKKVKEAETKNDLEEVKRLRAKILETAVKVNKYYNEYKK